MPSEPLIHWPTPIYELLQFVAAFLTVGPPGFRYAVARQSAGWSSSGSVRTVALRRAAAIGTVGAVLALTHIALMLPGLAARRRIGVEALVTGDPVVAAWILLTALAAVGYLLAWRGRDTGWALAAVGVIGSILRNAMTGEWTRLINPLHLLAGGLWIGTLFVLAAAGLTAVTRIEPSSDRRRGRAVRTHHRMAPPEVPVGAVDDPLRLRPHAQARAGGGRVQPRRSAARRGRSSPRPGWSCWRRPCSSACRLPSDRSAARLRATSS